MNEYKLYLLYSGGGNETISCRAEEVPGVVKKLILHYDENIDDEHYQCSIENQEKYSLSVYPKGLLCHESLKDFNQAPQYYLAKSREEVVEILINHSVLKQKYDNFHEEIPALPEDDIFGNE